MARTSAAACDNSVTNGSIKSMIDPIKNTAILTKANEIVQYEIEQSTIFDDDKESIIPRFFPDEVIPGRVLGRGGFCVVQQLHEIKLRKSYNTDDDRLSLRSGCNNNNNMTDFGSMHDISENDVCSIQQGSVSSSQYTTTTSKGGGGLTTRSLASRNSITSGGSRFRPFSRRNSGNSSICSSVNIRNDTFSTAAFELNSREYIARTARIKKGDKYVIKMVDTRLLKDSLTTSSLPTTITTNSNNNNNNKTTNKQEVHYLKGVVDISLEIQYLAALDHPNIVQLRGVCMAFPFRKVGQMIVLDNLPEIFSQRLNTWMQLDRTTRGITGFVTRGKRRAKDLLTDRLLVAYDIASALEYIHSKNIIYRDLKPDNLGFDTDGVVKLFDFGLAKEVKDSMKNEDDSSLYNLTGLTGAIRYMAPEVGLNSPYNQKADVYSFAMLFWYIMSLEPPLGTFTPSMFVERVFIKGCRPTLSKKWSKKIKQILRQSWQPIISERPTFQDILSLLRNEIQIGEFSLNTIENTNDTSEPIQKGSTRSRGSTCISTVYEGDTSLRSCDNVPSTSTAATTATTATSLSVIAAASTVKTTSGNSDIPSTSTNSASKSFVSRQNSKKGLSKYVPVKTANTDRLEI